MKFRRVYRWAMVAMAGGTLFQATSSCSNDMASTMTAALMPTLTTVLTSALTGTTTCTKTTDTSTSDPTSITTSGSNAFNSVGGAIQNAQSGFDLPGGSSSGSSGTGG
jgi:hypothetical protein